MENYFENLNENDKLAYRKTLTLESGEALPDPYSLRSDWIEDVDALPSIDTKGKLKAYKSLESYEYFV